MITENLLTDALACERVAAWLGKLPAGTVVGHAGDGDDCPIARYLQASLPGPLWPCVDPLSIEAIDPDGYDRIPTPGWAERFIVELDRSVPALAAVRAGRAREVLEQVRTELAQ